MSKKFIACVEYEDAGGDTTVEYVTTRGEVVDDPRQAYRCMDLGEARGVSGDALRVTFDDDAEHVKVFAIEIDDSARGNLYAVKERAGAVSEALRAVKEIAREFRSANVDGTLHLDVAESELENAEREIYELKSALEYGYERWAEDLDGRVMRGEVERIEL